jgi:RNA polymerase sigma-70 factor (ECF subfamily)
VISAEPATVPGGIADAQLAARVASGDGAAFELLMRRHNRRLFRIARSVLRDDADAEDALQESYLAAYRAIGAFRGEASLATWLSKLVLNHCLARRRKDQRRDHIAPMRCDDDAVAADFETPDRSLVRSELRALLQQKVDELPDAFRTVFVLRCVEELTVEETAEVLAIPEATVRSRHFRARGLLRESLAQDIDVAEQELMGFAGERCDRIVAKVLAITGA